MKIPLLDTNLLLALAWPNHQHHAKAHEWFAAHAKRGWATGAFTQLGLVRLSSNPAYSRDAVSPQDAAALLRQWTRHKAHHFWNSPAADAPAIYLRALGHQQVNDAWLVEVARKKQRQTHHVGYAFVGSRPGGRSGGNNRFVTTPEF